MVEKSSEIKVCGKFKKKKDITRLLKKYKKNGYVFRRIHKEKGRICMDFEEPKRKYVNRKSKMRREEKKDG